MFFRCELHLWLKCALLFLVAFGGCTQAQAGEIISFAEPPAEDLLSIESIPASFYSFTPDEYWAEPLDSYWMEFSNWVLGRQRSGAQRVQVFGEWADRTLSGSPMAVPGNKSYLRLGFAAESGYRNLANFKPEARFRLDVPTVKEKLRLIIESESDELIPQSERRRTRQLTQDERTTTQATGALRYFSEVGDAINLSTDVGLRLRLPTDVFWRTTARKQWQLDDKWMMLAEQRVYYFHRKGWGERTWLGFGRSFGSGWSFLASSELEWVHQDTEFVMSQNFNFYKELNNRASLNPRIGVLGESKPNWRSTSAYGDITFRYRMYGDWVFGEIIPAVEFLRENSFKEEASLILRVELYFSGNFDR